MKQEVIETMASVLQEWGNEATYQMKRNLKSRLKQRAQVSELEQSINFDRTRATVNGAVVEWSLNDYWIYIDLGVKGVKNKVKTYTSKDYPGGFKFKNLGVGFQMRDAMQNYIARKGIKVDAKEGQSRLQASFQKAYAMSKAVKKKGIEGTRFYSDVFNEQGFDRLAKKLEKALGQTVEITFVEDLK